MAFDPNNLVEVLAHFGMTMWIEDQPFGALANGERIGGTPKCTNCSRSFSQGITFAGDGSLCRECLDTVRQMLFRLIKEKFPEIHKREAPSKRS
jgi:hypothetical protein